MLDLSRGMSSAKEQFCESIIAYTKCARRVCIAIKKPPSHFPVSN